MRLFAVFLQCFRVQVQNIGNTLAKPDALKETRKMDQRTEFALRAITCENFRALCREYGISAKTGYR